MIRCSVYPCPDETKYHPHFTNCIHRSGNMTSKTGEVSLGIAWCILFNSDGAKKVVVRPMLGGIIMQQSRLCTCRLCVYIADLLNN
jgi:hypothetical protein